MRHVLLCAALAAPMTLQAADPEARRKPARELTDGDVVFQAEVLISPDGKLVAARGKDHQVRLWSLSTGKLLHRLDERPREIGAQALGFTRDGEMLLVSSCTPIPLSDRVEAQQLSWWDTKTGKRAKTIKGADTPGPGPLSPDGKAMLTGGTNNLDGALYLRDPLTAKTIKKIDPPKDWRGAAFTPDGKQLLTSERGDQIRLWDLATSKGTLLFKQDPDISGLWHLIMAPGGKAVAAKHSLGVTLIDITTGRKLWTAMAPPNSRTAFAFTPDGKRLIVGSATRLVVLDALTGEVLFHCEGGTGQNFQSLAVSPDGRWLATTTHKDKCVTLWKLSDW